MAGKLNLTNEEQLWIMERVKNNQFSVDDAQCMASLMSTEKELKKDSSLKRNASDLKKEPSIRRNGLDLKQDSGSIKRNEQDLRKDSGSNKRNEQMKTMDSPFAKAFTFGVVRFPYGFQNGSGIKNSMQIDFRKQTIYFMDKITIHVIIPFPDVLGCDSNEDNNYLKLKTKHTKIKFITNMENKPEIDRLISIIVQQNQYEMEEPLPVPPPCSPDAVDTPMTPEPGSNDMIMSFINERKLIKEGMVEKKGNASIVWWSKRFLRVEEREFSYYDPNKPGEPLGVVQINAATIIKPVESEKDMFVVTVGKRSYFFRVKKLGTPEKTEEERKSWIVAFQEACNPTRFRDYWIKNRKTFLFQDAFFPIRSPTPPADYNDDDEVDGSKQSHFKFPTNIEMTTFLMEEKSAKPTPVNSGPKSPDLKLDGPQCESFVPKKLPSPTSVPAAPALSPSIAPPIKPVRVAPPPPGPGPPPPPPPGPGPPPPPPPPPMPGSVKKPTTTLKAHCETKLKHFYVPKVVPKDMKKTLWAGLTDISPKLDLELLKKYFAEVQQDSHRELSHVEHKKTTIMSAKKAQNILILMKSNQFIQTVRNLSDLITSVEPPDENEIDVIRRIQKYQPTEDEIELYQKLTNDQIKNKADKIMATMSTIPCLQTRLELILNIWTFGHQYEEFIQMLEQLKSACSEILNAKKFPKVLEYLLAILNLMNTSGTANAGSATNKFDLKFLSQLKNISNANGFSLMEMLVKQIKKNNPELLDFHKELGTVLDCEKMSVKAIHANIEVLKQELTSIANNSKKIQSKIKNPTARETEFFQKVKDFNKEQQKKLDQTVKETDEIQRSYGKILVWFGLKTDTFSEVLFEYLTTFMEEFLEVHPAN